MVFQPLLSVLSKAAVTNFNFIRSGVQRGLSTTEITRELQEAGRGVRRQEMLKAVRLVKEENRSAERFMAQPRNTVFDPSDMPIAAGTQRRQYRFVVEIKYKDPNTGEPRRHYTTVETDELEDLDDILEEAELNVEEQGSFDIEDAEITDVRVVQTSQRGN